MNLNFLRLITVVIFLFHFGNSTAGEWGKDIKRVVIPFSLTADQLPDPQSKGAALFGSYCSQCHNLPSTKMHSADDWPMRFEKMMDHAMLMAGASPGVKIPAGKDKEWIQRTSSKFSITWRITGIQRSLVLLSVPCRT